MELSKWEEKFILKHIRKDRRLSFKQRSTIWIVLTVTFSLLLPLTLLIDKFDYLYIVNTFLLISLFFCSIENLCNILKKYDDKFKWELND